YVLGPHNREHRTEDFFLRYDGVRARVHYYSRADEVAFVVYHPHKKRLPFFFANLYVAPDLSQGCFIDQRSHVILRILWRTYSYALHRISKPAGEFMERVSDHNHP